VNQEDSEHNEVDGMKKGVDSDNYIVSNHVSDETNVKPMTHQKVSCESHFRK